MCHPLSRSAWLLLLPVMVACSGCGQTQAESSQNAPPTMVIVSPPVEESVTDFVDYTGRTEAVETVEIRSRVSGFLDKVLFKDGDDVTQGANLYQIDDREYQADLAVVTGDLTSAEARAEKAKTDFERALGLKKNRAISDEDFDRAVSGKLEAEAAVASASAAKARKQLDVEFSKITSPIAGRISRNLISAGNLVTADNTLLTTIVSVDPIYVNFDVDERTILNIQRGVREGRLKSRVQGEIPILLGLATDKNYPYEGVIDFIDNRVDPRTGTIRVRGNFPNPKPDVGQRALSPGLFSRVRVPVGEPTRSLLVTDRAVGTDLGRKFLYVVNDSNEVVFRPVELGARHDGLRVVSQGLNPGERVIIDGLQRVRPGSVVAPKPGEMRSRPSRSAAAKPVVPDSEADADDRAKTGE
ncbi:MAG: efflux RND transporter periplasmic adaptor subunit [Planctomycetota bacterium]|nr:efflux RND transporter periplasmic adaptor subunit [Planctomycetota bacterium]